MYRSCLIHVWKIYLELFKNSDSIHGAFVNVHIVSSGGFWNLSYIKKVAGDCWWTNPFSLSLSKVPQKSIKLL